MADRIPRAVIDQLLSKTNIVDLIDHYVPLKKMGANYKACCPFHEENTPSFVVSAQKQIYHCFGCGAGGNALSFIMAYDNLTFLEALDVLAKHNGITLPKSSHQHTENSKNKQHQTHDLTQIMQIASEFYQQQLKSHPLAKQAKHYLIERGLSGKLAQQFQLGFAPAGWDHLIKHMASRSTLNQLTDAGLVINKVNKKEKEKEKNKNNYYDRFRDRIMFPLRNRLGKTIAFGGRVIDAGEPKYLNSPETPIFHKSNELYGLYELQQSIRQPNYIMIVEGYMDVLALVQHDIKQVVGTLGTAATTQHIQLLFRYTDTIIFCFDGDQAGRKAAERTLDLVCPLISAEKTVRYLLLPSGQDPDSYIRTHDAANFAQQITDSMSLTAFLLSYITIGIDLALADDRAKFLDRGLSYLQKIQHKQFQQVLAQEIANKARLSYQQIVQLLQQSATTQHSTPNKLSGQNHDQNKLSLQNTTPVQKAIAICLQYPNHTQGHVFQALDNSLGQQLLARLLEIIHKEPNITTGQLLEYWRERPEFPHLVKLAKLPLLISGAALQQELADILGKLRQNNSGNRIDQLMLKVKNQTISQAERQELKELLTNKSMELN